MTDALGFPATPHKFVANCASLPNDCSVCGWASSHVLHDSPVETVKPNCPILVSHLNALRAKGGASSVLAMNLVLILDDVESIAGLIDHVAPAPRHAISRAEHIAECATRMLTLIAECV